MSRRASATAILRAGVTVDLAHSAKWHRPSGPTRATDRSLARASREGLTQAHGASVDAHVGLPGMPAGAALSRPYRKPYFVVFLGVHACFSLSQSRRNHDIGVRHESLATP